MRMTRSTTLVAAACLVVAFAYLATRPAAGASSSLTINATIVSSTTLDASACTTSAIDFGALQPGSSTITSNDCTITFGSSNDTASLHVQQSDGTGRALASAPSGARDMTYGTAGVATSPAGAVSSSSYNMVAQPDGKVLMATYRTQGAGEPFYATRLNADGSVDTGFGAAGLASVAMGSGTSATFAVALQADGKILLGGYSNPATGTGNDMAVTRLLSDGSLDTTFGTGGRVYVAASTVTDIVYDIVVRPDGRIILIGHRHNLTYGNFETTVVQLQSTGALDPTFGSGGISILQVGTPSDDDYAIRGFLDSRDRLVIAGTVGDGQWNGTGNTYHDAYVARITPSGSLDTAFNGTGFRQIDIATQDKPLGFALGSDDSIAYVGTTGTAAVTDLFVARITSTGAVQGAFNGGAPIVFDIGSSNQSYGGVTFDDTGRLVVLTMGTITGVETGDIRRYTTSGTLDPTFSGDGEDQFTVAGATEVRPRRIAMYDGGVLITGMTRIGGVNQPMAVRYAADTVADYATTTADWAGGASGSFGACLRAQAGTTPTWTVDGNATCTAVDTDPWRAIPGSLAVPTSRIAATSSGSTGSVSLRFGARLVGSQPPGTYRAGVRFSVVAPAL